MIVDEMNNRQLRWACLAATYVSDGRSLPAADEIANDSYDLVFVLVERYGINLTCQPEMVCKTSPYDFIRNGDQNSIAQTEWTATAPKGVSAKSTSAAKAAVKCFVKIVFGEELRLPEESPIQ